VGEKNHKPLAGKRVVVTRAVEQSQPLMEALRNAGAEPVLLPLLAFAPPDDPAQLDACLKNGAQFDWVFFTSQNALRVVQQRCAILELSLPTVFDGVKIAAVGSATAEAVTDAGLPVSLISRIHNGVALAEELASEVQGKRIFLPRSDRANPELIAVLKHLGAQVTPVVAYKTVSPNSDSPDTQESLLRNNVDTILFFSPSAVHHLRELLGEQRFRDLSRQSIFVAIGPVSENALKAESVDRILLATDTRVAAVVATLAEYFAKAGRQQPAGAKQG
jgi:uroporphyrinogen-III synthase